MALETVVYLTNIVVCAIIAVLMTHAWRQDGGGQMRLWMLAAWTMLVADILFAARPVMPESIGRIAPTTLVTVGQAILLCGARLCAGLSIPRVATAGLIGLHLLLLTIFYLVDPDSIWRRVSNGLIWAGLSIWSYASLRQSPRVFWAPLPAPARIFVLHAGFHLVRIISSALAGDSEGRWGAAVGIMGDLEVSFFMIALFVGLLIANLQRRNQELSAALAEVKTLTGLLPICAWCKKIRDDDGYWTQVDEYFRSRTDIRFTHGICSDCSSEHQAYSRQTPHPFVEE